MFKILLFIGLCLNFCAQAIANQAAVAMITGLKGSVFSAGTEVGLFSELQVNSILDITKHSKVIVVLFQTGREYTLEGPLTVKINAFNVESNGVLLSGKNLFSSSDGSTLQPKNLEQSAVIMRGDSDNSERLLKLVYPVGSKLMESRPTFKWVAPEAGYQYRLEIFDSSGHSLYSTKTVQTELTLPSNLNLPTEQLLTWEVDAVKGVEVFYNSADFMLAGSELTQRIIHQKPAENASPSEIALYIKILEGNSLKYEAEKYKQLLNKSARKLD